MTKPTTEVPLPRPFTFLLPGETWCRPVDEPRIDCYSDEQMISQYEAGRAAGAAEERERWALELRAALDEPLVTGSGDERLMKLYERMEDVLRTQAAPIAASPAQPGQQGEAP